MRTVYFKCLVTLDDGREYLAGCISRERAIVDDDAKSLVGRKYVESEVASVEVVEVNVFGECLDAARHDRMVMAERARVAARNTRKPFGFGGSPLAGEG